ncbi:TetR family transcriptional regulator [Streptomyces sp. SID486]|uniref:TetR/AcrR family transcriptional regulator C-terminal domain-containing protein n=1 Tax=unclassified Streptomyces TaxID=2593676 RepID=UPI00136F16C8|nr:MULTISPECIES: TetR/AcrR family transcriptional regulator C-terminal domain-containing protein [unclassified Streptomyces]MYW46262.1 TetR family transcriptional regulator [Streptomyces sp. SID161]MYX94563.1 TetR family transcriptional regulator [Streptomyces sp. SID486]
MPLRKADVVEGALRFLDAEGLDQLTMRRLGAALDVQGGALYRHFPNKEALLDAVADRIVEGVGDPLPDVAWPERTRILSNRLRTALLRHRDGARVVAGTFAPGANTIIGSDMAVQVLCGAGLPPAQAGWMSFALFYYVLGHCIEEQAQLRLPADHDWRSRTAQLDVKVSPQYAAALDSLAGTDPAERFDYGLHVFIDGLRRLQATLPPPEEAVRGTTP